jgi:metal-sulfur cluster biosynthetic enzyme
MAEHDPQFASDERPDERAPNPIEEPLAGDREVSQTADSDGAPDEASNAAAAASAVTEDQVKAALRKVKDPELNLNILDLGLVYTIAVDDSTVNIDMSLTSPGCPSGPEIMTGAEQAIRAIPGVSDVTVNLVWSPFWSPERIEPRIRAYLGL